MRSAWLLLVLSLWCAFFARADDDQVAAGFDRVDTNKDAKISSEEYLEKLHASRLRAVPEGARPDDEPHEIGEDEEKQLQEEFTADDSDRDGFVTLAESLVAFEGAAADRVDQAATDEEKEVEKEYLEAEKAFEELRFKAADKDGDGKLALKEYIAFKTKEEPEAERAMVKRYAALDVKHDLKKYDTSGDGSLDKEEVLAAYQQGGGSISELIHDEL